MNGFLVSTYNESPILDLKIQDLIVRAVGKILVKTPYLSEMPKFDSLLVPMSKYFE